MTTLDTQTAIANSRSKKELWIGPHGDGDRIAAYFGPTGPNCFLLPKGGVEAALFELEHGKKIKLNQR